MTEQIILTIDDRGNVKTLTPLTTGQLRQLGQGLIRMADDVVIAPQAPKEAPDG